MNAAPLNCCRRALRAALVLAAVSFCSCRAAHNQHDHVAPDPASCAAGYAMPPAMTGMDPGSVVPPGYPDMPWRPPNIAGPWPHLEYLCDGGDSDLPARVRDDWNVDGVEPTDTIAHYDTLAGDTVVAPSNRVCMYAPRFGAVRRVDNVVVNEGKDRVAGVEYPMNVNRHDDLQIATTAFQPEQPIDETGTRAMSIYRARQQGGGLEHRQHLAAFQDGLLPYEHFLAIQNGIVDQAEKARLAIAIDAAIQWTGDQSAQVILDGQAAGEIDVDRSAGEVYSIDKPDSPALRIIKIASSETARPGEFVDFTLRYDNVGDQVIGNVVVIDNLTTRLEYVPESQQSSRPAEFEVIPNAAGSDALRWELSAPLLPNEGGLIRFRTRVR